MNRSVVESLAVELGLHFEFIRDCNHVINLNEDSRDPDVVYLFEPSGGIHLNSHRDVIPPGDALLYFQGGTRQIHWHCTTKLAIRRMLEKTERKCFLCSDTLKIPNECPGCGCELCNVCWLKIGMTPTNNQRFRRRQFEMKWRCPECDSLNGLDVRSVYYRILDQNYNKDEFTVDQHETLMFLKEVDPSYQRIVDIYKRTLKRRAESRSKQFEKGMNVEICGMKKAKWNGDKAVIVGDRIIENKAIQWPVQLMDGSQRVILMKQCKMRKIGVKFWRKDKVPEFVKKRLRIVEDADEPDLESLWDDDSD